MAASDPKDPTLAVLRTNDATLKELDYSKWYSAASDEAIEKAKKGLEGKHHKVTVVKNSHEAVDALKSLIPKGEDVYTAHSTTLNQIGLVDYLKSQSDNPYWNVKIYSEADYVKAGEIRRQAVSATNYVSSVNAVGQDGSLVVSDASGSRVGGFSFAGKRIIVVVGSNKIVADHAEAQKRTHEFSLPTESARARVAYGVPGSAVNYSLSINSGSAWAPGRIHVIIVKEVLGF